MIHRELLIGGHFVGGECDQSIPKQVMRAPYDGAIVGTAAEGGWNEMDACLAAATEAFPDWSRSPRHIRQRLLRKVATLVRERERELAEVMTLEIGKPIVWSRAEVARLALTLDYTADLLTTYGTEAMPVDTDPRGEGYRCTVDRFPLGVIFCMVPYNWPYNLAAHKIAPALATGNTVVLKPSEKAPLSTLTLVRLIHEAGCPPGVLNAWHSETEGPSAVGRAIVDDRVKMLSFTGSPNVGWMLKEKLPRKKVALELGGNASAIVEPDTDLDWAVRRVVAGGYGYAGQVCIAVQHVWVAEQIYSEVRDRLAAATRACPYGDPMDETTVCGPLIDETAAIKVEEMVSEAISLGANSLVSGQRKGTLMRPTLVEHVPDTARLSSEEVFGPVLTIAPYRTIDEAVRRVNDSRFGIHCGVFTSDSATAERAFRELEVGGVIVNDYPTLRFDNMPYGGVKESGFGREGLRYAMDEMTEPKVKLERLL